ncbi:MAG: MFS family permease [Saprospiraceae bacterium]|jgi:MFS family permease
MKSKTAVLFIIVISQFCCTSMWFASNAVLTDLITQFDLGSNTIGYMTNAVQFGFIVGTLIMGILSISDRFSPSKVFFISAIIGALLNLGIILESNTLATLLIYRFGVGFCLAGIYPVGMKIASDYFEKGLGKSLSYLVAALVLGTAFPHLLKSLSSSNEYNWQNVIYITSFISALGGLLIYTLIPDGPFRKPTFKLDLTKAFTIFKDKQFRSYTFGYIGHMWELYAFWAFVPIILLNSSNANPSFDIPLWSFIIIASGSIACLIGGHLSSIHGNRHIAITALMSSGIYCLIFPFIYHSNQTLLLGLLLFWGMTVIADSPLFSALVAKSTPKEFRGTALTIATCIGFSITIVSIQLLTYLVDNYDSDYVYWVLLVGPVLGVASVLRTTISPSDRSEN